MGFGDRQGRGRGGRGRGRGRGRGGGDYNRNNELNPLFNVDKHSIKLRYLFPYNNNESLFPRILGCEMHEPAGTCPDKRDCVHKCSKCIGLACGCDANAKLWSEQMYNPNEILTTKLDNLRGQLKNFDLSEWDAHTTSRDPLAHIYKGLSNYMAGSAPEFMNRAWLKFYEILLSEPGVIPQACFTISDNSMHSEVQRFARTTQLLSYHLCEAPGGFISALNWFLNSDKNEFDHGQGSHIRSKDRLQPGERSRLNWAWRAQTLNPFNGTTAPGDVIHENLLLIAQSDNWYFGQDNSGNLINMKTLQSTVEHCRRFLHEYKNPEDTMRRGVDLITADGSFYCQDDPGAQEEMTYPLILAECLFALQCLDVGGTFILKIYSLTRPETIQIVFLLNEMFETLTLLKPKASKDGSSELYAVAKSFKGVRSYILNSLMAGLYALVTTPNKAKRMIFPEEWAMKTSLIGAVKQACSTFTSAQMNAIQGNINTFDQTADRSFNVAKSRQANSYAGALRMQGGFINDTFRLVGEQFAQLRSKPLQFVALAGANDSSQYYLSQEIQLKTKSDVATTNALRKEKAGRDLILWWVVDPSVTTNDTSLFLPAITNTTDIYSCNRYMIEEHHAMPGNLSGDHHHHHRKGGGGGYNDFRNRALKTVHKQLVKFLQGGSQAEFRSKDTWFCRQWPPCQPYEVKSSMFVSPAVFLELLKLRAYMSAKCQPRVVGEALDWISQQNVESSDSQPIRILKNISCSTELSLLYYLLKESLHPDHLPNFGTPLMKKEHLWGGVLRGGSKGHALLNAMRNGSIGFIGRVRNHMVVKSIASSCLFGEWSVFKMGYLQDERHKPLRLRVLYGSDVPKDSPHETDEIENEPMKHRKSTKLHHLNLWELIAGWDRRARTVNAPHEGRSPSSSVRNQRVKDLEKRAGSDLASWKVKNVPAESKGRCSVIFLDLSLGGPDKAQGRWREVSGWSHRQQLEIIILLSVSLALLASHSCLVLKVSCIAPVDAVVVQIMFLLSLIFDRVENISQKYVDGSDEQIYLYEGLTSGKPDSSGETGLSPSDLRFFFEFLAVKAAPYHTVQLPSRFATILSPGQWLWSPFIEWITNHANSIFKTSVLILRRHFQPMTRSYEIPQLQTAKISKKNILSDIETYLGRLRVWGLLASKGCAIEWTKNAQMICQREPEDTASADTSTKATTTKSETGGLFSMMGDDFDSHQDGMRSGALEMVCKDDIKWEVTDEVDEVEDIGKVDNFGAQFEPLMEELSCFHQGLVEGENEDGQSGLSNTLLLLDDNVNDVAKFIPFLI